jgi:signal transduction histidine kinase/CheY-like chemotaxis protein
MTGRQRIFPVRRDYNRWVANQTLEDFALRFTAKSARRWSTLRVAQTAIGAISFLALEAIGGVITLNYGFTNAAAAILVVSALIFAIGLPIGYYASRYGVDIDLLTRGAGFGYIGSTITSLIYATFTFIFFAIEASIMSMALQLCFGIPLTIGYLISSIAVIPLVTHGITFISRFQLWTQPLWIALNLLPFIFIAFQDRRAIEAWTQFPGSQTVTGAASFNIVAFGAAASVVIALVAQIGEQVDFLRFLPASGERATTGWWAGLLAGGPGWILLGGFKLFAGSFLAVLALRHGASVEHAADPPHMYEIAFRYVTPSPELAIALTGAFVIISQLKINVTNAYAGSIAWSNFFSRLTHSHPGRVVWLVFNVAIALLLMELGIYSALEHTLGFFSIVAVAWIGALVSDLVVNKPLGLSPPHIEFKRAHLYDINPVGVGAMAAATALGCIAFAGAFGEVLRALAPFVALVTSFVMAPAIAAATRGRYYLARKPRAHWRHQSQIVCRVCDNSFETEDMAFCPAYSGPICSLCCSLDARCHDLCKPQAKLESQVLYILEKSLPAPIVGWLLSRLGRFASLIFVFSSVVALILLLIYIEAISVDPASREIILRSLWSAFFILLIVMGIVAWLLVLAQESRQVVQEESVRQNMLLLREIEAHKRTDAALQQAKEIAEAANFAKSRYIVGISHELRTPLNAILGYAQLLDRDSVSSSARPSGIRVIRRSAEHLSGLIDGLLDISKIETGRLQLQRDEVHIRSFLDQVVDMFRLQAEAKRLEFRFSSADNLPQVVHTDEKRLRQILINLLSNAIKFTEAGHISLRIVYRTQVAEFSITDSGAGISASDLGRIFEPFERGSAPGTLATAGLGLGLTITKLLAQILGGDISVSSELGKGSTFKVRLMLSPVMKPSAAAPPAPPRIYGYKGTRRTILVVDDNADHRDLMRELLAPIGFIVLTAGDGPTCLAIVEEMRPDLFILDISLPGMNGWDLARILRDLGHKDAAILMMSANIGDAQPARKEGNDHDGALPKPFEVRQLFDRLQTLLGLEWIDEPIRIPLRVPARASVNPGAQRLDELLRLARIGYIRGIEAKLTELETEEPDTAAFVDEMRVHVRAFDIPRLLARLETISAQEREP